MRSEPTFRVLADFAFDALELRLIQPEQVVAWADSMIAAVDEPAEWMIYLAMADPTDLLSILDRLRAVPGPPDRVQTLDLLDGLIWREWILGRLTIDRVRRVGWQMYLRNPEWLDCTGWGIAVEEDFGVSLDEGHITECQMCDAIARLLRVFAHDALRLPTWA